MANGQKVVLIIGAGLTGLACSYYLEKEGFTPRILERESAVGGRLRTDRYRGFLLDRGFRVVFSAAPEVNQLFGKGELALSPFLSGAKFRFEGEWYELRNPFRHPFSTLATARFPSKMWPDLWGMARLYRMARKGKSSEFESAVELLDRYSISSHFRTTCIRPLLATLLLDLDLASSSESFLTLLRLLGKGYACLPAGGIEAVPRALRAKLRQTELSLNTAVRAIEGRRVILEDGEVVEADAIVLAVEQPAAARLLGFHEERASRAATCLYFRVASDLVPTSPILYFDGSDESPINQLAFLNLVEPSYAPRGELLVSATVLNTGWQSEPQLVDKVRQQLSAWFHTRYTAWNHLRDYKLPHVVPEHGKGAPPFANQLQDPRESALFYGGELSGEATINGSLESGRKIAAAVATYLK